METQKKILEVVMRMDDKLTAATRKMAGESSKNLNKVDKSAKEANKSLGSIGPTALKVVAALGGLYMLKRVADWLGAAVVESAQFTRSLKALDAQTQAVNISASDLVNKLQDIMKHQVSLKDTTLATNRAIALLGKESIPQFDRLADVALRASKVMGISVTQAFDNIVTGIGRESRMILDNLGIIVSAEKAYSSYAMTLGKTAESLTDAERKQAFMNEAITQGEAKFSEVDVMAKDAADSLDVMAASIADLRIEIGEKLVPATMGWLGVKRDLIETFTDPVGHIQRMQSATWLLGEEFVSLHAKSKALTDWWNSVQGFAATFGGRIPAVAPGTASGVAPGNIFGSFGLPAPGGVGALDWTGSRQGPRGGGSGRRTPTGTESDPIIIEFSTKYANRFTAGGLTPSMLMGAASTGLEFGLKYSPGAPPSRYYGGAPDAPDIFGRAFGLPTPSVMDWTHSRKTSPFGGLADARRSAWGGDRGTGPGGSFMDNLGDNWQSLLAAGMGGAASGGGAGFMQSVLPAIGMMIPGLGPLGGAIGGLLGGLFGKKKRGETPSQPIYVRDPWLESRMTDLLNVTKSMLTSSAGMGIAAIDRSLYIQAGRVGAT